MTAREPETPPCPECGASIGHRFRTLPDDANAQIACSLGMDVVPRAEHERVKAALEDERTGWVATYARMEKAFAELHKELATYKDHHKRSTKALGEATVDRDEWEKRARSTQRQAGLEGPPLRRSQASAEGACEVSCEHDMANGTCSQCDPYVVQNLRTEVEALRKERDEAWRWCMFGVKNLRAVSQERDALRLRVRIMGHAIWCGQNTRQDGNDFLRGCLATAEKERDEAVRDEPSAVTKLNTVRGELQGQRDENKTIIEDVWRLQKERDEARAENEAVIAQTHAVESKLDELRFELEAAEKREATLVAAIEEHLRAYDLDDQDTREEMAALIDAVTLEAGRGET